MRGTLLRRLVCLLAAAALAGCGGNYAVYGATTGAAAVGTAGATTIVSDGGLTASIALGATAASFIVGVGLVSVLMAGNNISPIPPRPMRPDREVNEQDCTAPIASSTANLKCR